MGRFSHCPAPLQPQCVSGGNAICLTLIKMCKPRISLSEKRSLHTEVTPDTFKHERRRLRKVFKDLSRRCVLTPPGVDRLEFLKFVDLPGLLGQQFFKTLDIDEDQKLGQQEFISGITALYKGPYTEITTMLFSLLEFNKAGYVRMEETRLLLRYLPRKCKKCDCELTNLETKVSHVFGEHAVLSLDDLVSVMAQETEFFDELYVSLLSSLPIVFDDAMDCVSPEFDSLMTGDGTLRPLRFEGQRYFFEIKYKAFYYYKTQERTRPKGIILLENLFVRPVGTTQFELRNLRFAYCFEAQSEAEREDWVDGIHREIEYQWFDDVYETAEHVGSGAYGQVLKVRNRKTGDTAAVKIISKEPMDLKSEDRIRREIAILKFVNHKNLLHLIDVFETNDRIYLVTELITGGPLFAWLESKNFRISEDVARSFAQDIAHALGYLHSCGIVHRDIKLENVLLRPEGNCYRAVLIDYGLSCFLGPGENTNEPVGTLKYVAPEIILRMQYREKVDCWSLGVIVYILLQGTVPFFGNDQEVAMRILRKKLRFDSDKWQKVSAAGRMVLEKLLSRKPERRLSMSELLHSEWLLDEDEDEDEDMSDNGIAVPASLELATSFQKKIG